MTSQIILSKEFLENAGVFEKMHALHIEPESVATQETVHSVKLLSETLADLSKRYASQLSRSDLKQMYSCLDITTLGALDNDEAVTQFCGVVKERSAVDGLTPGAICVYPAFTQLCIELLNGKINVAVVEDAFPHGQSPIEVRVFGVRKAVEDGAREIDMVIRRGHVLSESFGAIEEEVSLIRKASGDASLKVILNTTEMKVGDDSVSTVYYRVFNASIAALKGGAHMLKTSTGKEGQTAHLEHSILMYEAIRHLGVQCGFKAAGGVRTVEDALSYYFLALLYEKNAVSNKNFRIGASALADEIVKKVKQK